MLTPKVIWSLTLYQELCTLNQKMRLTDAYRVACYVAWKICLPFAERDLGRRARMYRKCAVSKSRQRVSISGNVTLKFVKNLIGKSMGVMHHKHVNTCLFLKDDEVFVSDELLSNGNLLT